MAKKLTYLKVLRSIHFYVSIMLSVFILYFVITGFILTQPKYFPHGEAEIEKKSITYSALPDTGNHKLFLRELKKIYHPEGRAEFTLNNKNEIVCYFSKPGVRSKVIVLNNENRIYLETARQLNFSNIVSQGHATRKYFGGWVYVIYGIFYDLAEISLILFAVTGILIWLKLRKSFKFGWVILSSVILFVGTVIFLLWR